MTHDDDGIEPQTLRDLQALCDELSADAPALIVGVDGQGSERQRRLAGVRGRYIYREEEDMAYDVIAVQRHQ